MAAGLGGITLSGSQLASAADTSTEDHILVVLELSGGNDGLNTFVPYGDDAYYRHRPTLGIRPDKLLKIDDHFGFNAGAQGLHLPSVADVAAYNGHTCTHLAVDVIKPAGVVEGVILRQRRDVGTGAHKGLAQMRADKAGTAGNQYRTRIRHGGNNDPVGSASPSARHVA